MNNRRLAGKVAIVSGAGSVGPGWGNGRATAVRFAQEGARVLAADIDAARLAETVARAREAGGEIETFAGNATEGASVAAMIAACKDRFGRVDILVNNVGGSAAGGPVEGGEQRGELFPHH